MCRTEGETAFHAIWIISLCISGALGLTAYCRNKGCSWDKTTCILNESSVDDKGDTYELNGWFEYSDQFDWLHEYILIESSNNKTYLEDLQRRVWHQGSTHRCQVKTSGNRAGIMLKYEPDEKEVERLKWAAVVFACITGLFWLDWLYAIARKKKWSAYTPINSEKGAPSSAPPPAYGETPKCTCNCCGATCSIWNV